MTDEGRGSEYQRRVLALGHEGVLELWQGLRAGVSPPDWPAGVLLEYLILRAFQLEGAEVTWPYRVYQDGILVEQIDGAIYFDGVSCLVEFKDVTRPVDTSASPASNHRGGVQHGRVLVNRGHVGADAAAAGCAAVEGR